MIEYLMNHPELIASVVLFVLTIICMIIKRRPKSLDEFVTIISDICKEIPNYIVSVECPGHGEDKKEKVISLALKETAKRLGRSLTDQETASCWIYYSEMIEKVLEAPQRKESIDG